MDFELDEDFLAPEPVAAPAEQAESAATAPNTAAGNGSPEPIASTSRQTDDLLEVRATKRPRLDLDYELDQEFGATEPEGPAKDDLSSSVQELMQSQSAQKTTMAARPAFSVSNLDLSDGRQYSSSVTATTFDGKKITFKRRPQRSIQQLSVRPVLLPHCNVLRVRLPNSQRNLLPSQHSLNAQPNYSNDPFTRS